MTYTKKEIRDFAAYLGATVDGYTDDGSQRFRYGVLDMERIMTLHTIHFNLIKLRLRPLSALTEEELRTIADTIGSPALTERETYKIRREGNEIGCGDFSVNTQTLDFSISGEAITHPATLGKILTYLQFVHIYFPGLIDEKYVNLSESHTSPNTPFPFNK